MNLLYVRFANSFLEPIGNRNYIGRVQITLAESLGAPVRGSDVPGLGALHSEKLDVFKAEEVIDAYLGGLAARAQPASR